MVRDNRNARGLATARALERAAVDLARTHGPDGFTIDQICAIVGVTQRTFFNHFDTKDDALLGLDLPQVDEARAREYLADPSIGVLAGALGLVRLPDELVADPATALDRMRIVGSSPTLLQRQAARFRPVAEEVEKVIALKLRSIPGAPAHQDELDTAAATIASLAAALLVRPGPDGIPQLTRPGTHPAARLHELAWVWDKLL